MRCALSKYFDPFKGKTKYCFKVLAPFKKPVQGTCLVKPVGSWRPIWRDADAIKQMDEKEQFGVKRDW